MRMKNLIKRAFVTYCNNVQKTGIGRRTGDCTIIDRI